MVFHEIEDICGDAAMRLNADAVYEVMCRAVQEGRANAHSESRARYIEEHKLAPRLQTSLRPWLAPIPGKAAQCVKIFDSPKVIVQLVRDPNCEDRVAVASSDGQIVVVRCANLEW